MPELHRKAEINDPIPYYWMVARAQQLTADSYVETSAVVRIRCYGNNAKTLCGMEALKYEIVRAYVMQMFAPKASAKRCIVQ